MSDNIERQRKRILDARAALDRATTALSNDPEYEALADLRSEFDYRVVKPFYERVLPGSALPQFMHHR